MPENKKIINFKIYSHYNILIYEHSSFIMGKYNYCFIAEYKLPVREETKEAQYWKIIIISRTPEKIRIGEVL